MQQTLGDNGVSAIAARFDLSDRQFRRILTNMFGFGPKKVQRIVRLQLALRDLMQSKAGATLDGYYDDPHRIRELRLLTGMTPGDIRRMAEIYNQLD
jgi:AraC-like DNA-binding protein